MIYIIESPSQLIEFTGITNDECKYSTTIHIDQIGNGVDMSARGLT